MKNFFGITIAVLDDGWWWWYISVSGNDNLSSKRCISSLLPDVRRATSIRMLGVTLTNHLSVSDHVRDVISRCAQSLHALKIMRCHGMNMRWRRFTSRWCSPSSSMLLPPGGALQPHQIKVGWLKHTYDARFGSICIKTLTPLRHNLLRTPITLCSKTF